MAGRKILQLIPSDGWRALFVASDDLGVAELHPEPFPAFCLVEGTDGETFLSGVLAGGTLATDEPLFVEFVPPNGPLDIYMEKAERIIEGVH